MVFEIECLIIEASRPSRGVIQFLSLNALCSSIRLSIKKGFYIYI